MQLLNMALAACMPVDMSCEVLSCMRLHVFLLILNSLLMLSVCFGFMSVFELTVYYLIIWLYKFIFFYESQPAVALSSLIKIVWLNVIWM